MKVDGDAEADGKVTPLSIEKLDQDYRQVGPLYEPHRQVVRLTGFKEAMDPKQRAEMEKSMAQMEEMKKQIAAMPEAQRKLIEGRMQAAMKQMEQFAGDGSLFETVIDVESIQINQGPPGAAAGHAMAPTPSGSNAETQPVPAVTPPAGPPPRDDLQRFSGLYGVAGETDGSGRNLFVTQSCNGQMVAGATFGDASNWWMTPVSDAEFEMSSDFISVELVFEMGPDGNARALHHNLDWMPTPLTRIGPLPEGWADCVQDERR
jgi:hypothetical protein